MKKKYVVGITGASGIIYARRLLELLTPVAEVHIIITDMAYKIADFDAVYVNNHDMFADIASGSFQYDGMVIVPCSMKTLASISVGISGSLITRVADVCLKEKRECIIMPREMPLSRIHLKNMLTLDEAGATIMVLSPGFYMKPESISDLVDMVVARILDHLRVEHNIGMRWSGV